jgi:hypothetical protein
LAENACIDLALALTLLLCPASSADTEYYRHTFFDNSNTPDSYFYSNGKAVDPSVLVFKVHAGARCPTSSIALDGQTDWPG